MSEISKFTVFPYGSYLKFRNDSGKTANVFDPKNNLPKIRKPPTLRIAEKTSLDRKITELKNSSQDLQRLNNFFSDMSKNIYEKADLSAMQFRKFLETSQGDDLINKVTEEAFLQEDRKIKDMIRVFDDSNDSGNSKFSNQSGLLKSWSPIRTFDDEEDFEEEISDEAIQRMAFEDRIINSINLVNHLGELGFNKLAGKLIKKIDTNIDSLNEKYPSISPPRLGLATMALENSNDDAPDAELKEFLNKSINKTQFIQADATSIKDFYMSASSKKGYQEEANQALMQAIAAQHEDPSQTNTVNVYVLDKLFAYAVENQLIKNPKAFIQNIQAMREGAKLPEDFSNIYSVINQSNPVFEKNDKAKTNLVLALCQIKENLGMEYFRKKDLSKINEKIVDHLKAVKENDFPSFAKLFDQIINDEEKYPRLGSQILNEGFFFYDESFPLFDLGSLLACFTNSNSDFKHALYTDQFNEERKDALAGKLPSVYLHIKNFESHNTVFKTNTTESLPETDITAFTKRVQINEMINGVIDKLPLDLYNPRDVANHYFALCDEGHISSANHLLNRKIEQLNDSEDSQEKFKEFADILKIFGYVKSKGLISESSLNLDNKVLKTYSKILENPPGKLEKGFDELLETIQDEKMNPQYTIMLLNQLTGNIIQNDDSENTESKLEQESHSAQVEKIPMSDEQKELFTQALKQRIFLTTENKTLLQINKQKEKRVNELSDLLDLSNQLLSLKIFNAEDIEHLRNDYGDLDIIKKIDKKNISGIFNPAMQNELFLTIIEYNLDNGSKENNSLLYILIDKAFESTRALGNFDKLSKLLNKTLKETPIFHGNVKNDLKLSLMILDRLPDDFFNSSRFNLLKSSNENYSEGGSTSLRNLLNTWAEIKGPRSNLKVHELNPENLLSPAQIKASRAEGIEAKPEQRKGTKTIGRRYSDTRLLHEITKPLISQAPALKDSENLLETVFHRIFNNYEILKRQYEKFPADKIDSEILTLASRAEEILLEYKFIDKTVFADKFIV